MNEFNFIQKNWLPNAKELVETQTLVLEKLGIWVTPIPDGAIWRFEVYKNVVPKCYQQSFTTFLKIRASDVVFKTPMAALEAGIRFSVKHVAHILVKETYYPSEYSDKLAKIYRVGRKFTLELFGRGPFAAWHPMDEDWKVERNMPKKFPTLEKVEEWVNANI